MPRKKSGEFDQAEYNKEYIRTFIKYRKMNLNTQNQTDMQIMEWLDQQPEGVSAYLKRIVLEDMRNNKAES